MSCKLGIPLIAWVLTVVGCNEPEEITVYTIPKETKPVRVAPPNDAIHNRAGFSSESAPVEDARMLAAFVRVGDRTWFFKLQGKVELVGECAEAFDSFVRSVRFEEDGKPGWTLPEEWKQLPGKGMRFATLLIESTDKPLEVSVMALPHTQQTEEQYALANINRWRGQLAVSPIQKLDDQDSGFEKTQIDGKTMYLFDLIGKMRGGGTGGPMSRGPMSRGSKPNSAPKE